MLHISGIYDLSKMIVSYDSKTAGEQEEKTEKLLPILFKDTIFENDVYISGGYVRDEVMGIISNDLDLVIEKEDGSKLLSEYFKKIFHNSVYVEQLNVNYPTYNVKFLDNISFGNSFFDVEGADIDISDTVKIRYPEDSELPKLYEYGTLMDDCLQRDFTINTLYKDVNTGKIIDLTGFGIKDINNKILRTIPKRNPNKLFYNQPKALLRLCRFYAKYDMTVPTYVTNSASNNAYRIKTLSVESIQKELNKMNNLNKDKIVYMMKKIDIYYFINKLMDF